MNLKISIFLVTCISLADNAWSQPPAGVFGFDDTFLAVGAISGNYCVVNGSDVRGLRQSSVPGKFEYGNALASFDSIEGYLEFRESGNVLWSRGEIVRKGTQVNFADKEITFSNSKVKLSGTMISPQGQGPFPFVIFTHGSGPETRDESRGLAYFLAVHGIGSLIYDKRGTGKSEGKEWQDTFDNYAGDAVAAAESLSAQSSVSRDKIGIYGHSQGGWIVPLALSKSRIFSFAILSAANAVSPVDQTLDAGDEEVKLLGLDDVTIAEIRAFRKLKYEIGISGKGLAEFRSKLLPEAEKKPWFRYTGGKLPEGIFWKANGFYDPAPALIKIDCPVLVVYGEYDISTNASRNLPLMKNYLKGHDAEFRIFRANHWMMEVHEKGSTKKQAASITKFADGYLDGLIGWIKRKVGR